MAYTTSYDGTNSGLQVGQNLGHITTQFLQSEASLNQACLRDLRTTNPHHDKDRIQNTNGGLLKDSYCWIFDIEEFQQWQDNQSNCLLWIRGDPGKGKTMLLCGVIEELTQSFGGTANVSFFFCQATDVRINNATAVLRGLIYSLVKKQPSLLSHVKSQYDHAGKALFEDINAWNALSRIFTDILKDPTLQSTYLIIDALDECTTGLTSLLHLITHILSVYPQVKWIVSSRNWPDIEERLDTTHTAPISLELNEVSVSEAVSRFIQHRIHHLAKVKKYTDDTRHTICRHLSSKSQGTFLWVALVCQELDRTSRRHALKKLEAFPPGLDALYDRMIDQVRSSEDAEPCKRILAVMSIVYRPVAFDELASLIELPDDLSHDSETLSEVIATCGSFLTVSEKTINFVHQSARDFLLRRTQNGIFPRGIEAEHHSIFSRSLQAMFKTLRRDIFRIQFPGFPIDKVITPSPNPLAAAKYACIYWIDHLEAGTRNESYGLILNERVRVDAFLQQKYLHWLEALSVLGSVTYAIQGMKKLEMVLQEKDDSETIIRRAEDALRFIRYHRTAIESTPLQVYCSPLIFSPAESFTRTCYQKERPDWVLNDPVVEKCWGLCLQALEGHTGPVFSIAWSQDGSRLASASIDKTIRIWDPTSGQSVSTLERHAEPVSSISWSPDGSRLASASYDKPIRIWDPTTGQNVKSLEGHSSSVSSIAWSPDGSRLASASYDYTIRIWHPATGQSMSTLEGHNDWVRSIAWSQDGSRLASASNDKTVRIWDSTAGQSVSTLTGHSGWVTSVAWSQERSRLASASNDNTVRIWDPTTGQSVSTLEGHSSWVTSIAWSQDGSRLASASDDKTVRIWDPATGQCMSTLEGHSHWIRSIAWSQYGSRLASASNDKTVRIWDTTTGQSVSTFEGHSRSVNSIAWTQDGDRLASASDDKTIRVWHPVTGQSESAFEGHGESINSICWSPDGSRLASASHNKTVRIWDPTTGQSVLTLEGHSGPVFSIAWSHDGSRLASASFDKTVRIWHLATGKRVSTLRGYWDWVTLIAWSQDGKRLALASGGKTITIWDSTTGQSVSTLEGHSGPVCSTAWSPDGSRVASASDDKTIRIWDPTTGQRVSTLEGHSGSVILIVWSPDGSRLASASDDKTVKIWDPTACQSLSTIPTSSTGFLQFDELNSNRLHTSIGTFDISSIATAMPKSHTRISLPERYRYGLSDDSCWITFNGVNLLWLPTEYRPVSYSLFAIFATKLAIGCSSGRVTFLVLTEHNPLSGF